MENNDIKKITNSKNKVIKFLDNNRYDKNESNQNITHQSYGIFRGTFYLDKHKRKEFMQLYNKAIKHGVKDLSILEKQGSYAPIIVDIDLEMPHENYEEGTRLYNNDMIDEIVRKYIKSIDKYIDIPNDKFRICIFEKTRPTKKDNIYKDGFHLMFPDLCIQTKMRHLIRCDVVKICEEDNTFEEFLHGADKIIDKAVVSSNGWFLYGSTKPDNGQLYTLSYICDQNLNKIYDNINKLSYDVDTKKTFENDIDSETIVNFLSLQSSSYSKKKSTPYKNNNLDIDAEFAKLGISSIVNENNNNNNVSASKEEEIRKACKYTSMLSDERAKNYHDWMFVGLALHNVDDSLLSAWIEFSKKSVKHTQCEYECEKIWKTIKNPSNGNVLTIRSLVHWAREDNPKEFEAFNKEEFKNTMNKSLDGNNYFLAKSVHSKYSDRFVCSSITKNVWWEFRHHRWIRVQDAYTLKIALSEDFADEYNNEIIDITTRLIKVKGMEKEELQNRRSRLDKIVSQLMSTNFKETLIKECKNLFYDDKFEQKLDSNLKLIGFENGIYDLDKNIFREGRPDDYITMSTNNNYYKWTDKNPIFKQILKFFEQVFPNENVRKYFLTVLSTCVSGETKEEKLYMLTGSGSNGKSLTNDLMSKSLGDYYMSCDISLITRKRGQSNQAAPEKVRMKGRRCGIFQEADEDEKMNVGLVKEMTGGDIMLMRDLFKGSDEMIEIKPQMKYFLTANKLPDVPSTDDGTWRRLRVIQFISKFVKNPTKQHEFMIDTNLKQKIDDWANVFASYLIHLYITVYKNTEYLIEPPEVMSSTDGYKLTNDYFTEYFSEKIRVTTDSKNTINKNSLWEDFRQWYRNSYDYKSIPKRTDFILFMTKRVGEPNSKGYTNIVFVNDSDSESDNEECTASC